MKILCLNFSVKGLGTYRRSYYFSRELARCGHDVTLTTVAAESKYWRLISFKKDWVEEFQKPTGLGPWVRLIEGPNIGNKWLPGWGSGPLDIWTRTLDIFRNSYDAIIGFEYHPNVSWPVYITQPVKDYRFYSDWCDWFAGNSNQLRGIEIAHKIDAFFENQIRLNARKLSVTSQLLKERALSLGISDNNILHIPEGAATDYIAPMSATKMREKHHLPNQTPILAAVRNGDMRREIRIFRLVKDRYPDALFLMIGRKSESALRYAAELDVAKDIISTGWVTDTEYPEFISCADICFCPLEDGTNDAARWPAKILDYLSAGRATVTNPVGEVKQLFTRSKVGVLADQSDEDFADKISLLVEQPGLRRQYGDHARHVMEKEWDWLHRGSLINSLVVI